MSGWTNVTRGVGRRPHAFPTSVAIMMHGTEQSRETRGEVRLCSIFIVHLVFCTRTVTNPDTARPAGAQGRTA